ncbi:alpha/beta hydrolase [Tumebacillus algifaecis]|nr:alpha/beta hydrolase-fold protein [Tumebacillus algifaecis]
MMAETKVSPTIAHLERELQAGNTDALSAFWDYIAQEGAPLIEETDNEEEVLLTFLWQSESESTENVYTLGGPAGWRLEEAQLTRLLDTDLYYRTLQTKLRSVAEYYVSPNDTFEDDWVARLANLQEDPLNRNFLVHPANPDKPATKDTTVAVLNYPGFEPNLYRAVRQHAPQGEITQHRLQSAVLENERSVWVYTPPGYSADSEPYRVLVLFDGFEYDKIVSAPTILDNLVADGKISPVVAVFVNANDRRNEEMRGTALFAKFAAEEVTAFVRQHYNVSTDPKHAAIGGCSNGGLMGMIVAMQNPNVYGNVLSQSGSFAWGYDGEPEWFMKQLEKAVSVHLNVYMDVGNCEQADVLESNYSIRDQLRQKGANVHFTEFKGGHDWVCWRETFADAVVALFGN